tara:strand:+ start:41488 stop:41715 length:228 start_codon:yes stop_codon:yes gene_type:complete
MNIIKITDSILGNWYVIGISVGIALLSALVDQAIYTTWVYDVGFWASIVFSGCVVYVLIRTFIEFIYTYWKHRKQ